MITEEDVKKVLEEYKKVLGKDLWLCDMENKILASTLSIRDVFLQETLQGHLKEEEVLRQAEELHLPEQTWKTLFLVQVEKGNKEDVLEILQNFFPEGEEDFVFNYSETDILIIKYWNELSDVNEIENFVHSLLDTVEGDSYSKVIFSSSLPFLSWKELYKAGRQAKQTMQAGRFFYQEYKFFDYEKLKLERLVYSMSKEQCEDFIEGLNTTDENVFYDKDLLNTASVLMDCQGNAAETARTLYVHRNTLNYRLEKIKRLTGLDVKKYKDAAQFQMLVLVHQKIKKG